MQMNDLTGQVFGLLTAVRPFRERAKDGQVVWELRCACGNTHRSRAGKLRQGEVKSCGCAKPAACAAANIRHGMSARGRMTAEYRTLSNMIDRCERETHKSYPDYGGRGIRVCDRWRHDPAAFLADMGPRPSAKHTIERVDNDRGYEPGNCVWILKSAQNKNRRGVVWLEHAGRRQTLVDWARDLGVRKHTLYARHRAGWSASQILQVPVRASAR